MAENISINIITEIRDAVKGIQDFSKSVETEAKKANDSFKFLENTIKGLGGLLAAKVGVDFFKSMVDSAIEAEDEFNRLKNALKLTGGFSEDVVKQFKELADETKNLTGISSLQTIKQITYLKTLGATNTEVEKVIKASRNLSVIQGQDLASSVDQLVASYSGNIRSLGRQFKEIKNLTTAQLQNGGAVDILIEKYDQLAKDNSKNLGVQLNILEANLGALKKAFGALFIGDSTGERISFINSVLKELTKTVNEFAKGKINDIAGIIIKIVSAISALLIVQQLSAAFSAVSASIVAFRVALTSLSFNSIIFNLGALISLLRSYIITINLANAATTAFKAVATLGLTLLIDQFIRAQVEAKSFSSGLVIFFTKIRNVFIDVFGAIINGLGSFVNIVSQFGKLSALKVIGNSLKGASKDLTNFTSNSEKGLESLKKGFNDGSQSANKFKQELKGLGGLTQEQIKELEDAVKNVEKDLPDFKVDFVIRDAEDNAKKIKKAFENRVIDEQKYTLLIGAIRKKLAKDIIDTEDKIQEEQVNNFKKFSEVLRSADFKKFAREFSKNPLEGSISLGLDISNFALQGQKGAVELGKGIVKQLAASFGPFFESLAPGFAQAFEVLSQGKDKVAELVNGFIQGIPVIVQNVITAIPQLLISIFNGLAQMLPTLISQVIPQAILEFVNRLPEIITALANAMVNVGLSLAAQMPLVATRLSISLVAQSPTIARSIIVEMVRNIPLFVSEAGKELAKGVKDALAGIGGVTGIGGGGGGILGGLTGGLGKVGKIFGFADGIGEIPSGFPRDSFAAGLTSGERVVDADSNNSLKKFLSAFEQGRLNSNQPLTINIQVGEAQLAQTILNLNRQGFRLS